MVDKDDWRLLNDVCYLKGQCINPTNGKEITKYLPHLKHCIFCYDKVNNDRIHWFVPDEERISCCICEKCFADFCEMFDWRLLDGWDITWDK
jgi:hypothetical protein